MVDVFISYSRRDQEMVAKLARAIEAEGYDVWWDAELPPHQSYGEVITAKIAAARAAVVVWSDAAVQSEWVRAEADMARNQRKLIQTALGDVMPPLPFNQIQYAGMGGWQGEDDHPGWRKVKLSLAELCGTHEAGGVAPPTPRPAVPTAAPARAASRWPLFAGIGVGAIALAAAGAMVLGQRGAAPEAAVPAAAALQPEVEAPGPAPAAPQEDIAAVPEDLTTAGAEDDVPLEPNPADLTFPDSSTRLLAPHEVASLGPATLKVARNEIFARKGRRFRDPWLRDWFSRFAWYRPRFDEVRLNPIEQGNVRLIQQAEAKYR